MTRPAGKRVTAAAVYTTGTNVNSALAGAAAMADEVMRHAAIRYGELFLDSAEGDALERVVTDHVEANLTRRQPSPAVVPLNIARAYSPQFASPFTLAAGTVVRTEGGIEFKTLSDVNFPASTFGNRAVDAQALLAGTAGNVDYGTIRQFAQAPTDTGITVNNLDYAAGGSDIESDRDYLARAKLERGARKMGVETSLLAAALAQPGVKSAVVVESLNDEGDPDGLISIYVADINGRSNSTMVGMVQSALRSVRVCGIIPYVVGSTPTTQSVMYAVSYAPNTDATVAASRLRALTASMINELATGETLQRSMLFAIARTIPGIIVDDNSVYYPSEDVTPTPGSSIKTRSDLILVNGV